MFHKRILFAFRDDLNKFMESIGATKGTMTLTTNLYKPFTRLDKYPSLLKELERHIEVNTRSIPHSSQISHTP